MSNQLDFYDAMQIFKKAAGHNIWVPVCPEYGSDMYVKILSLRNDKSANYIFVPQIQVHNPQWLFTPESHPMLYDYLVNGGEPDRSLVQTTWRLDLWFVHTPVLYLTDEEILWRMETGEL